MHPHSCALEFIVTLGFFVCLFIFSFLGPHLQHTEVPRLRGELEPQLPAYITATAMSDP